MSRTTGKWFCVINPAANRGNGTRCVPEVRRFLSERNIPHEILVTTQSSEAMPYVVERAADHDVIIAAGGDGTVHEVVNGLMQAYAQSGGQPPKAALGVLPIGSGNDFAKMLQMPKELRPALEAIATGSRRLIDIGRISVDGDHARYFDNNVGIGFDAYVNYESIQIKSLRGVLIYLAAVFKSLFKYQHPMAEIRINGETINNKILMMTTGNGSCSGGGFYITPHAKIDDGWLDVCIVDSRSKLKMLLDLPTVMQGKHDGAPGVRMYRTKNVRIASSELLPIHADGEVVSMDAHTVELEVMPTAIHAIFAH